MLNKSVVLTYIAANLWATIASFIDDILTFAIFPHGNECSRVPFVEPTDNGPCLAVKDELDWFSGLALFGLPNRSLCCCRHRFLI